MQKFVAQRGELCLLTLPGYIALAESAAYLPAAQAPWAPECEQIVGYVEGEAIYRLLPADAWTALLKEHRQRQVNAILDSLRQRGLYDGPPQTPPASPA
jgi:hypothetical protein